MTLKELIRSAICGEMEDISACETDGEAFPAAAAFYGKLADEKRERLPELGRIFKEGTGFRQRRIEPSRSLEASLRARAARASEAASVYAALVRQMNKPEYKEALKAFGDRELIILGEVRAFKAGLGK